MRGRDYCRTHGGTKPIGPANPSYRHGRRSKYLAFSKGLAEKYSQALEDPELLELRADVALLDARINELLESGESHLLWEKAVQTFLALESEIGGKNIRGINSHLHALRDLLLRGRADSARWQEVYKLIELSGRTREREFKRLAQMESSISVEYFLAVMGMIARIAAQTITDHNSLRAFVAEIDRLVPTGHSDSPDIPARAALPSYCGDSEPAQGSTPPKRVTGFCGEKEEETTEQ